MSPKEKQVMAVGNACKIAAQYNKDDFTKLDKDIKSFKSGTVSIKELEALYDTSDFSGYVQGLSKVKTVNQVINDLGGIKSDLGARMNKIFKDTCGKNYNVGDTSDIRIVDMSTGPNVVLYDQYAPFKGLLGKAGKVNVTSDLTFKWPCIDYTKAPEDSWINVNKGPDTNDTERSWKQNTMGFLGDGTLVGMFAEELNKINNFPLQESANLQAMLDKMNINESHQLMNATINANGPIYRPNGLLNCITTNVYDSADNSGDANDLTDEYLDNTVIKPMFDSYGSPQLVMAINSTAQQKKIDDLRLSKTGHRPMNDLVFGNFVESTQQALRTRVVTVYVSRYAGEIPVVMLRELPTSTAVLLTLNQVKPVTMHLPSFSGEGPYMMISKVDNGWAEVLQIWKPSSLMVQNELLCAKITNLN